jgi:hypothetical protein
LKVLNEKQIDKSLEILISENGSVINYIASEFEPMSKEESQAFKMGFYACIDLSSELLRKLNAGELKENVERGILK